MSSREKETNFVQRALSALLPVVAVVFSLLVSYVMIWVLGADPLQAMTSLFQGAFGSLNSIGVTLTRATPLLLAGLGVTFAFRCGIYNIGAEGQIYMGALAAVWAALNLPELPYPTTLVLSLMAGFAGGALWGAIPGLLKATRGVNEIISTILLNYVAIYVVSLMVQGPMIEPPGWLPHTPPVPPAAELPIVLPGVRMHGGTVLGLLAALRR
jgi:simple sugar transport system permease protein